MLETMSTTPATPETPEVTDPQIETEEPTDPATPDPTPWGDDFDAEKAWSLIQNLRGDKEKLQGKLDAKDAPAAPAAPEKPAADTELAERLEKAEKAAADAARALLVERARGKHNLTEDLTEFLTGTTEEEIEAQAVKLSSLAPAPSETEEPVVEIPQKPTPDLVPGHGGSTDTHFNPAETARRARRR